MSTNGSDNLAEVVDRYQQDLVKWLSTEANFLETQIEIIGNLASISAEERTSQWVRIAGGISQLRQLPYQTEAELDQIRSMSRDLAEHNPFAINILENGKSYIYGQGHTYRVKARADQEANVSEKLLRLCRLELDMFRMEYPTNGRAFAPALDKWWLRQLETWQRRERDGEVFRRFFEVDGFLYLRFIEPEQVVSPGSPIHPFGIEFASSGEGPNKRYDLEKPITYFVRPDYSQYPIESGRLGEPEPIPADQIQHIKVNVDMSAPRGIPTFYPIDPNLRRASRILRNMSTVTEMQAAIAWVKKHLSATAATIQQHVTNLADITRTNNATGKSRTYREFPPGSILETNAATEYQPWATSIDVVKIVAALQAELRAIASRVQYPEFMISSDASNSNYSSTMVAEGPATKKFERMQWEMIGYDLEVIYRAFEVASRAGRLPENILELIEIEVEPPSVKTRNVMEEVNADLALTEGGASGSARVMSKKTLASRHELDYDKEKVLIEEEARATATLLQAITPPEPSLSEPGGAGGKAPVKEGVDPLLESTDPIQEAQRRVSRGKKEGGQFTSTGAGTDISAMFSSIHVGAGISTGTSVGIAAPGTNKPVKAKAAAKPKTPKPAPKITVPPKSTKPAEPPPTAKAPPPVAKIPPRPEPRAPAQPILDKPVKTLSNQEFWASQASIIAKAKAEKGKAEFEGMFQTPAEKSEAATKVYKQFLFADAKDKMALLQQYHDILKSPDKSTAEKMAAVKKYNEENAAAQKLHKDQLAKMTPEEINAAEKAAQSAALHQPFSSQPLTPTTSKAGYSIPAKEVPPGTPHVYVDDAKVDRARSALLTKADPIPLDTIPAVQTYTGSGYHDINMYLRSGMDRTDQSLEPLIQKLQDVASRPLPEPMVVYRGIPAEIGNTFHNNIGQTVTIKGFVSTSLKVSVAASYAPLPNTTSTENLPAVLRIKAKTGVYVQPHSSYKHEEEVVQAHNTRYRVAKVTLSTVESSYTTRLHQVIDLEEI